VYSDDCLTIKLDDIEGMGRQFIQVRQPVCFVALMECVGTKVQGVLIRSGSEGPVGNTQVQGKEREKVAEAGKALGLDGTYIPFSYIEQVRSAYPTIAALCLHHLSWQAVPTNIQPVCRRCLPVHILDPRRCSWKSSQSSSRW
jgi:hypothetical protein